LEHLHDQERKRKKNVGHTGKLKKREGKRKEGRKEGWKEGRKEGRNKEENEGRRKDKLDK